MIDFDGPNAAEDRREYYRWLAQQRAAEQAAAAAKAAADATDKSQAAANPAGRKFTNNRTEANRKAAIDAYTPVYDNVTYELELAKDRGENVDDAAKKIKARHKDDAIFAD